MANRWGNSGNSERLFSWSPKSLQMVTAAMKLRYLLLGRKAMTNLDSILRSRDVTLPTNVHLVKALVFPVVMYGLWEFDYKESWVLKNWCSAFFTVQLSHPYMTTGKTIALTRWTFAGKIMSLLFNKLSRLVITFLPRSKCLLISWLSHHLQWCWSPQK